MSDIQFAWLEITGKCQLACQHCYADSGPHGSHGRMGTGEWRRITDELADAGVGMVQFIGGEPMLHPDLAPLIEYALQRELRVEVFSNLVHVPSPLWSVLERPDVSLATSYYTDDPDEHAEITGRPTHAHTRANIAEATRRQIPIRAGVINLWEGQRSPQAQGELASLGMRQIGTDRLRGVGRGAANAHPDASQLCGQCASGVIAISPDGAVWPCVFARWMPMGNVLDEELAAILDGPQAAQVQAELHTQFAGITGCMPHECNPQCSPSCSPSCRPAGNCRPVGNCSPNY